MAPATAPDGRPGAWYPSGKEVQLWASPLVLWALRNAGVVPVQHGGVDRAAIDYLVRAVAERRRPMAIAPEGMATFRSDHVPELDPGTTRIALLAAERLAASGSPMPIDIVPVGIEYRYSRTTSPARLATFLGRLERRVGLAPSSSRRKSLPELRDRILAIWERLVAGAEASYARWGIKPAGPGIGLRARTLVLLEASIGRLEAYYGVGPAASLKARILNIRAESLKRVFYARQDLAAQSTHGRAVARRGAAEAFFLDNVYQAAGIAIFLDPESLEGEPSLDRLVEAAQNLHDFANRLEGLGIRQRSRYFRKDALVVVGQPIRVERLAGEGRRGASDRLEAELEAGFRALL